MHNVIKMDLYRMFRSKITWVILILVGILATTCMVTMHREHEYIVSHPEILTEYNQQLNEDELKEMKLEYAENPKYSADGVFDIFYFYSKLTQDTMGYLIAFFIALFAVVAMLVAVVGFGFNVGLVSFLIAALLFIFNIADDNASIKGIPWGTIIMILGVGILMSVVSEAGGITLLTGLLSKVMNSKTVAPLSGITAGLMSLVSSGLGVVYPTLIPIASDLVSSVGGGNPVAVISAIVAGGSLSGLSPISTAGALTLGAMATMKTDMTKEEQSKGFFQLLIIAVVAMIWVPISAALFANLFAQIFG